MATGTLSDRMTADEFALSSHKGFELVDGEPVELPMSVPASWTAGRMHVQLANFAMAHQLGEAFAPETGIRCYPDDPQRVRKPDGLFIRAERLTPQVLSGAFLPVVPDLVLEVVSPTDLAQDVMHKVREYLNAGVKLVWVIYPEDREAIVYRANGTVTNLQENGFLEGEDVLPEFRCRLADVLPPNATGVPAKP